MSYFIQLWKPWTEIEQLELFFSKENMPNVKPWINIK